MFKSTRIQKTERRKFKPGEETILETKGSEERQTLGVIGVRAEMEPNEPPRCAHANVNAAVRCSGCAVKVSVRRSGFIVSVLRGLQLLQGVRGTEHETRVVYTRPTCRAQVRCSGGRQSADGPHGARSNGGVPARPFAVRRRNESTLPSISRTLVKSRFKKRVTQILASRTAIYANDTPGVDTRGAVKQHGSATI